MRRHPRAGLPTRRRDHSRRPDRRIAGLAAATLVGAALGPTATTTPALADDCRPQKFQATADADLLHAEALDTRLVGGDGPLVDVTIGSTRTAVDSTAAEKSRAWSKYLTARALGQELPAGPLSASVSQVAPPHNERAETLSPTLLDVAFLRLSAGELVAHARWLPEYECRTDAGVLAEAFGTDVDVTLLPNAEEAATRQIGSGLLALPPNSFSQTAIELVRHDSESGEAEDASGVMATVATAWIGLTRITLLDGTDHELTVRVIDPPELTGYATGSQETSEVLYTSPILEIEGPDGTTQRIDAPGESFELTLPPSGSAVTGRERTESTTDGPQTTPPDADQPDGETPSATTSPDPDPTSPRNRNVLADLLDGLLGGWRDRGTDDTAADSTPPATEAPDGAGDQASEPAAEVTTDAAPERAPQTGALTLRISLGDLESTVSDAGVRGEAATIRVQVLASTPQETGNGGATTLADVSLGHLAVTATAPRHRHPAPVATEPAAGGLPTTGVNLLAVLATGALLLAAGRLLMVYGRRRSAAAAEATAEVPASQHPDTQ